ncbi:MAG: TonB-dependent siderophore receptor [Pseudomonadota bacterium]
MLICNKKKSKQALALVPIGQTAINAIANSSPLLPLGAMLLAGSMSAMAQQSGSDADKTLKAVIVKERAEAPEGKDSLRATSTSIGKGKQELRDIPQSITVVTEKLVDDRNLDTLKDVLHNTAGVTFQAAEGGEEDIRLRGFSLATTGDIFVDGMRDPAFYERDTFNNDRIELLRGSASMLFGRGSTGGAVNQVSKQPRAIDESEISTTLGSHNYRRVTGDFNIQTGESAALRINAMATKADNNGAGSSIDKKGIAATYRFGIGSADEFSVGLYDLENNNGMNYGLPWIKPTSTSAASTTTVMDRLDPSTYYGLASDYNAGSAQYLTVSHTHRFQDDSELKTSIRKGIFERDQRANTIRLPGTTGLNNLTDATVLSRSAKLKIQDLDTLYLQSDYSHKFSALGVKHELLTGIDFADERKNVYRASGSTNNASTQIGTPDDGVSVNESQRILSVSSAFKAQNMGVYAQDMIQVAPHWKVLAGLRYDSMDGKFDNVSTTGVITSSYKQTIADWSKRFGILYQPNELSSYHFSYGTSFNTSADTYSYSALSANTDPEQSRNIEIGAKLDSADKRFTTRLALFHSVKYNERNTDPDSAATAMLLSGQRHTAGFEMDVTGRLTEKWEVYGSYMWMPEAAIDVAAPTAQPGERQGERPSLTPVHSGTVWTTYQLTPELRVGAGVNFRSEQSPNRNPGWLAAGYATVDLMSEYKINERYTVKGNISNIANTLFADSLYSGHYVPGAGRVAQVTLNVKF